MLEVEQVEKDRGTPETDFSSWLEIVLRGRGKQRWALGLGGRSAAGPSATVEIGLCACRRRAKLLVLFIVCVCFPCCSSRTAENAILAAKSSRATSRVDILASVVLGAITGPLLSLYPCVIKVIYCEQAKVGGGTTFSSSDIFINGKKGQVNSSL